MALKVGTLDYVLVSSQKGLSDEEIKELKDTESINWYYNSTSFHDNDDEFNNDIEDDILDDINEYFKDKNKRCQEWAKEQALDLIKYTGATSYESKRFYGVLNKYNPMTWKTY
jgi:hydroxylamine reductase (hybrid-cluster protein)